MLSTRSQDRKGVAKSGLHLDPTSAAKEACGRNQEGTSPAEFLTASPLLELLAADKISQIKKKHCPNISELGRLQDNFSET